MSAFLADLARHHRSSGRLPAFRAAKVLATDFGVQAIAAYRLGKFLLRNRRQALLWPFLPVGWLVYILVSRYVRLAFGIHLSLSADIGAGLYIGHFGGVLITGCRVGALCSVSQSTRIYPEDGAAGPTLGDRVWVGAHARIIGPVTIGNGCAVSAAAIVRRDIPASALCMGNPARIVIRDYDNTDILNL